MGAAIGPSEVEVEPIDPLNRDKSPGATDRASDEAIGASEEARKGGGRRKRGERRMGEEEAVKIIASPLAAGCFRRGVFKRVKPCLKFPFPSPFLIFTSLKKINFKTFLTFFAFYITSTLFFITF
jgi:hypothetical protein